MKSNFVSSVSHELRAPIASVRLMAESLERGKIADAPKQHEYFRFIGQECRRLSSLIENVLDFSRIEEGRKQYELEPTDLVALTRQTVKLMETYAKDKQEALKLDLDNRPPANGNPELRIDGRAMQQALVNLIDNAIKHSPKGGTVTIGVSRVEGRGMGREEGGTSNIEHRTSNIEHRTSNIEHRTSNIEHRTSDGPYSIQLWVEDHGEGIPQGEQNKKLGPFDGRG